MNMTNMFFYGTLKKGFNNHHTIMTCRFVKCALTKPEFTMIHLGGFPGILQNGNTPIHGEVYEVSDHIVAQLDKLEGHPHQYKRTKIELADGTDVETYVYLHKDRARGVVESGIWTR